MGELLEEGSLEGGLESSTDTSAHLLPLVSPDSDGDWPASRPEVLRHPRLESREGHTDGGWFAPIDDTGMDPFEESSR